MSSQSAGMGFEIVFTLALHCRLVSFQISDPHTPPLPHTPPPKTTTDVLLFPLLPFFSPPTDWIREEGE